MVDTATTYLKPETGFDSKHCWNKYGNPSAADLVTMTMNRSDQATISKNTILTQCNFTIMQNTAAGRGKQISLTKSAYVCTRNLSTWTCLDTSSAQNITVFANCKKDKNGRDATCEMYHLQ
ncbi:hypothetical protein FGO68_gene11975 [Halteria grandinella]|uniref:Uncharacterized protein n=1 Tax=Halteria grandinella TaxID=5974 RepID=A0A8J8T0T6_HALGN|nr:hypothetical protein FGO68_gene11975 [Halteria grandinella]